jgi:2,4-dienoyl-CoA reductase-like NADH-dependent reductase (Old Yellow Enzyme family)/NADPH-dependent 2,4-dienoyl-CoA reductase/sulfur reductase-like enzyme
MRVATTANLADSNRVGARMLEFYRTIARGGVGVIVTEALRAHPMEGGGAGSIRMWERAAIPGMRKLSRAVHDEGALLIGQLNHGGRQHLGRAVPPVLIAPSPIACPRSGGVPHEMTLEEVEQMVEWFATSAVHCLEAGMDGVEIHGAQGHLIQQFFSPYSNRRDDIYGGSFENRSRFAREIIARVRRRIGPNAIIGYRMGVEEFTNGGITIEDAKTLAALLAQDGIIDYLSLSQGNFNSKDAHLPDRHFEMVPYRSVQSQIRPVAQGLPVVMCTRIQTAEQAEGLIAAGEADMVGFCRAFIVDPGWPNKAKAGRKSEIRRCIACNQCWGWISEGWPIGCAINPTLGREFEWAELDPIKAKRKILVVGGGPSGLEAARVAALRGHDVTIAERAPELGGRIRTARRAPHSAELGHAIEFLAAQVAAAGVRVLVGVDATPEFVLRERPDAVVIATGATPVIPEIPGDRSVPVMTSDGIVDPTGLDGDVIVIMDEDGYFWPAAVAEAAARIGKRTVFATRHYEPFREIPAVSRIATLRELDRLGVEMRPNMAVDRTINHGVVLRHYQSGREEVLANCAAIFWIGMQRPNDCLAKDLGVLGHRSVTVIGDAYAPRRLPQAISDGHAYGRAA